MHNKLYRLSLTLIMIAFLLLTCKNLHEISITSRYLSDIASMERKYIPFSVTHEEKATDVLLSFSYMDSHANHDPMYFSLVPYYTVDTKTGEYLMNEKTGQKAVSIHIKPSENTPADTYNLKFTYRMDNGFSDTYTITYNYYQ